jgi:hypothetical protein
MDPNNQNPQGENSAVNKLEQDLQNMKEQSTPPPQPVTDTTPVKPEQPIQEAPIVPDVSPVFSTNTVTPPSAPVSVETNVPIQEVPKKGSPLTIIAVVLALVALLAVAAYVFGAKLLTPQPTPTPATMIIPTPAPAVMPTETPGATVSAAPLLTPPPLPSPIVITTPSSTP